MKKPEAGEYTVAGVDGLRLVDVADLRMLVLVTLGTISRRRKRNQEMMSVSDLRFPLEYIESIAKKYQ